MPKIRILNHAEHGERLAGKEVRSHKSDVRIFSRCSMISIPSVIPTLLHHSSTPKLHELLTSPIIVYSKHVTRIAQLVTSNPCEVT